MESPLDVIDRKQNETMNLMGIKYIRGWKDLSDFVRFLAEQEEEFKVAENHPGEEFLGTLHYLHQLQEHIKTTDVKVIKGGPVYSWFEEGETYTLLSPPDFEPKKYEAKIGQIKRHPIIIECDLQTREITGWAIGPTVITPPND